MTGMASTTGLNAYYNVTLPDIAQALEPLGFVKMDLEETKEWAFSKRIRFENAPTIIRIYTGIIKSTGQSRPAGADAIRVCLGRRMDSGRIRIFKTLQTVRRTVAWSIDLIERIESLGDGLTDISTVLTENDLLEGRILADLSVLKCPKCGAQMVGPKSGRLGPFYGCRNFPECRGLANVTDCVVNPEPI